MNKEDFLRGLQNALSGEVPPNVVRDNLNYYENYIRTELQNGRDEDQVMGELGDPRLIAKTIIDTTPGAGAGGFEEYRAYGNFGFGGNSASESHSNGKADGTDSRKSTGGNIRYYDLNKWYWKAAGVALVILIVMVIVMLISGILSILIPLIPFILIAMMITWFFRGGAR